MPTSRATTTLTMTTVPARWAVLDGPILPRVNSSSVTTLDTYSHVIPAIEEEAATKVAKVVFGG
jgi:hypothetical protein